MTEAVITYQNVWGMSPSNRDKRYIIGQSVFFPLFKPFTENPDIRSPAGKSKFKLVYLDELNLKVDAPYDFVSIFLQEWF
ncbi:MAG: hypothetical protein NXI01_06730 [Gammaproteobacteria bacterium]|nr:hypothetical protein [Gammaproteobacteria bacterium]